MHRLLYLIPVLIFCIVAFFLYQKRLKPDERRISKDREGNTVYLLNELEQKIVGRWYKAKISSEGFLAKRGWQRKKRNRYHDFKKNGLVNIHVPTRSTSRAYRWKIDPADSLLELSNNTDTFRYDLIKIEVDELWAKRHANPEYKEKARFVVFKPCY